MYVECSNVEGNRDIIEYGHVSHTCKHTSAPSGHPPRRNAVLFDVWKRRELLTMSDMEDGLPRFSTLTSNRNSNWEPTLNDGVCVYVCVCVLATQTHLAVPGDMDLADSSNCHCSLHPLPTILKLPLHPNHRGLCSDEEVVLREEQLLLVVCVCVCMYVCTFACSPARNNYRYKLARPG